MPVPSRFNIFTNSLRTTLNSSLISHTPSKTGRPYHSPIGRLSISTPGRKRGGLKNHKIFESQLLNLEFNSKYNSDYISNYIHNIFIGQKHITIRWNIACYEIPLRQNLQHVHQNLQLLVPKPATPCAKTCNSLRQNLQLYSIIEQLVYIFACFC